MQPDPDLRPVQRPRRLRRSALLRDALADTRLAARDLIYPLFIRNGSNTRKPVDSMPEVEQLSPDLACDRMTQLTHAGVSQFLLFGVIEASEKDASGSAALSPDNPVATAIKLARKRDIRAVLHADLCFCEYTEHGHCGVLDHAHPDILVDNDATLELLSKQAVMLGEAGADVIAPSGMMDGAVAALRDALDQSDLTHIAIMGYSIKYASSFYGPFRDAGEGGMKFGDRKSYQMDYRRTREWQTELDLDIDEGADIVMIKPAGSYLDIISRVRDATDLPVAAYQVSGEYSMIHAAAERGWLDLRETALETTYAIKRAGADLVITYFAPQLAQWL